MVRASKKLYARSVFILQRGCDGTVCLNTPLPFVDYDMNVFDVDCVRGIPVAAMACVEFDAYIDEMKCIDDFSLGIQNNVHFKWGTDDDIIAIKNHIKKCVINRAIIRI